MTEIAEINRDQLALDIWPQISVLSNITIDELKEILRSEFTLRQVKDLRRELIRLRCAYIKQSESCEE